MRSRIRWWALIGVISPALIVVPPSFGSQLWFVAAGLALLPLIVFATTFAERAAWDDGSAGAPSTVSIIVSIGLAAATAVAAFLRWDLAVVLAGVGLWSVSMLQVRRLIARQAVGLRV